MTRFFKIAAIVFGLLYVAALLIYGSGTFGWFGQQPDPLSGVFLMPLGMPWTLMTGSAPQSMLPWVAVSAPLINLLILLLLMQASARRASR